MVTNQFSYNLGTGYEEVMIGIVSSTAVIYDFINSESTVTNTTAVSYNADTGMVGVNYGSGLYDGGGHCARVIVMYR